MEAVQARVPAPRSAEQAPSRWIIDPTSARVTFGGRIARFAPEFRARFGVVEGVVTGRPTASPTDAAAASPLARAAAVDISIPLTSMTTGKRTWDDLLTALDPFEVQRHPIARFSSSAVRPLGRLEAAVEGTLALHGVVRSLVLHVSCQPSPGVALHLHARGVIDRQDFAIRCDLPGLSRLVPRQMELDIEVQALPAPAVDDLCHSRA